MDEVKKTEVDRINALQERFFDASVDLFEPPYPPGVPERLARIAAAGDVREHDTVLDVGSGTGALIPYLLRYRPSRILANDLSRRMLERNRLRHPDIELLRGDVRDLDLPDQCVDAAFLNGCFSNLADKEGSLRNLARMLKRGGRLVIAHPLGREFIEKLRSRIPFPLDPLPGEGELRELLLLHGFGLIRYVDDPGFYLAVAKRR